MHETQERKNSRGNQEDLCIKLTLKLNLEVGILQLEMVDGNGISQAERGPGGWEGRIFENQGLVQDGTHGGVLSTAGPAS